MNYHHAFHAGNFADVHKHVVLSLVLAHLREKPSAFRVLDTHAGAGVYDLTGPEATRTGEWRDGIGRLVAARFEPAAEALLAPYRGAVAAVNPPGALVRYPGSPALARALLRPQDRLVACETAPAARRALAAHFGRDPRAKALALDGWTALGAFLPPKERRGLVLIDPPFEDPNETARTAEALAAAHRKWPTGIYLVWYPRTGRAQSHQLADRLVAAAIPRILASEMLVEEAGRGEGLRGSGVIVINPPWRLDETLSVLLPALARVLGHGGRSAATVAWLAR